MFLEGNMFHFKKTQTEQKPVSFNADFWGKQNEPIKISEPQTLANIRLTGGAKDFGHSKGLKMYNAHKAKLNNQWINPLQSINSGYGTAQWTYYNYQTVNYYECFSIAQDPLMNKVFNLLSNTPFAKGGQCVFDADIDLDKMEKEASRYNLVDRAKKALRSSFVVGGCLLYMDFGLSDLEQPLDLGNVDMRRFKGFRHIDPINIQAVDVNTIDPSKADYMKPKKWYVLGLGVCDSSHFLKWEENVPELMMRPLCMYFGMPLTQLVKADIANTNLTTQGVANLINRFRYLYYYTDETNFSTSQVSNFKNRLETMSLIQDNWSVMPISNKDKMEQMITPIQGLRENVELFYSVVASKTGIPLTELLGTSAKGLDATGEGDRKSWYDEVRRIQDSIKENLKKMYGIIAGLESGKYTAPSDYIFNPIEELNDKEMVEVFKGKVEIARGLIELGAKMEDVFEWLKKDKRINIDVLEMDESASMGDYGDFLGTGEGTDNPFQANNDAAFESKHKRDNDGKFAREGGKGSEEEEKEDITAFLGEEFKGLKGKDAIDKLMQEKRGHVKGAFTRKDIGDIDLIWGDETRGLFHIIQRRKDTKQPLGKLLSSLSEVIEKGKLTVQKNKRFALRYKNKVAIIEPKIKNGEITFLFTAFYEK